MSRDILYISSYVNNKSKSALYSTNIQIYASFALTSKHMMCSKYQCSLILNIY